jgi:Holliday junction resolvase RusA-like endonuclease
MPPVINITLPYPPSELRPNKSRTRYWRKNADTARAFKALCQVELRAQGVGKVDAARLHISLTYCAKDRSRRDLDADLAASKAMIDALSDALGVDDQHFSYSLFRGQPVKGGAVNVVITEEG